MVFCFFRYRNRFLASLPASRRASADFTRPVFIAVAFYLCAKKHKVGTSMNNDPYLCFFQARKLVTSSCF